MNLMLLLTPLNNISQTLKKYYKRYIKTDENLCRAELVYYIIQLSF